MDTQETFVYEGSVSQASYNKNIILHESDNHDAKWVGKISNALAPWADFRDLDDRGVLAYRLSQLAGLALPEVKIVSIKNIIGYDFSEVPDRINDNIFLTKFSGINLLEFLKTKKLEDVNNFCDIYKFLVFNLWVGSYDKKTEDYLINEMGNLIPVDYQLLGPGFVKDISASIGGWLTMYYMSEPSHTGWCFEGAKKDEKTPVIEYVRKMNPGIEVFLEQINTIKNIKIDELKNAFSGLNFRGQFDHSINDDFINYLIDRRESLEGALVEWIQAGYPNQIDQVTLHNERKQNYFKSNLLQ